MKLDVKQNESWFFSKIAILTTATLWIFKYTGVVDISWTLVTLPLWIFPAMFAAAFFFACCFAFGALFKIQWMKEILKDENAGN